MANHFYIVLCLHQLCCAAQYLLVIYFVMGAAHCFYLHMPARSFASCVTFNLRPWNTLAAWAMQRSNTNVGVLDFLIAYCYGGSCEIAGTVAAIMIICFANSVWRT